MKSPSKVVFNLFDQVIELAEMGEDVESIARTVKRSGTAVKALLDVHHATREGRIVDELLSRAAKAKDGDE